MELLDFERKAYSVKAVRVTEENMQEVAKWCGGAISDMSALILDVPESKCIDLVVDDNGHFHRRLIMIGDWIVHYGASVNAFKNHEFEITFKPKIDVRERYDKIINLLSQEASMYEIATELEKMFR
jgi:hypothetical protein